jgi:tRNA dimethylallyltransferase
MAVHAEHGRGALHLPPVVAVVGPTATGKTALAVRLARALGGAELVNADSRQVLRGLRVGTNTPSPADLAGLPCHLLGIADPGEPFSVADWLAAARSCLTDLKGRGALPILVGGTGLYVRALLDGADLDGPPPDPRRRASLNARAATPEGLAALAGELRRVDPDGAAAIDLHNPRRVVRALEIVEDRGSLAARGRSGALGPGLRLGLDAAPSLLRRWITERSRAMLGAGLLDETRDALHGGVAAEVLGGCGIGYREALEVLAGRLSEAAAAAEIVRRTLRYARAQRTWFRADHRIVWLHREGEGDLDALVGQALELMAGDGPPGLAPDVPPAGPEHTSGTSVCAEPGSVLQSSLPRHAER